MAAYLISLSPQSCCFPDARPFFTRLADFIDCLGSNARPPNATHVGDCLCRVGRGLVLYPPNFFGRSDQAAERGRALGYHHDIGRIDGFRTKDRPTFFLFRVANDVAADCRCNAADNRMPAATQSLHWRLCAACCVADGRGAYSDRPCSRLRSFGGTSTGRRQ